MHLFVGQYYGTKITPMRTPSSLQNLTKSRHHKQEILFRIKPTIIMSNMVTQTQPSTQHVLDQIEEHERDEMVNSTSTVVTSHMMVTQTQPSAQVLDQMEDALGRTHHNGTMNGDENKLARLEKVCIKKTMIQMRLDGWKQGHF
jgi:ribosome-binding ATPase YchF (GTP1/OBG family)